MKNCTFVITNPTKERLLRAKITAWVGDKIGALAMLVPFPEVKSLGIGLVMGARKLKEAVDYIEKEGKQ